MGVIELLIKFKRYIGRKEFQLARNLSVATVATLTLILMVVVNQYTYQSISRKPECVFVPLPFFQKPYQERANPHELVVLSDGSEEFLKRMYEYYLTVDWILDINQSYYFSPVSVFLVMGYIASGLNPTEDVIDYGVTSLEELLVGMSFPCLQSKLIEELDLLLKQEAHHLYITSYIDKDYDARKVASLYPNTQINITRDISKLPLLLKSSRNILLPTETYFSLKTTTYQGLKFALHIGIDIFAGTKIQGGMDNTTTNKPEMLDPNPNNDALIILSKYSNNSMNQYRYTHIGQEQNENFSFDYNSVDIEFLDRNDLTWKTSTRKLVENEQRMVTDDADFITFRCNNVTIHNITSINTEAIILKNPGKTNLTLVILLPSTKNFDNSMLKERFSGTDFKMYEHGEGHDEFVFNGALTIQVPLISGKTSYQLPIPFQMNAITRIFYDGREGDQFHKTVTDWYNIVGSRQPLHVPNDGIWHKTSFDSMQIAELFGIQNFTHTNTKDPNRNTEWVPREPLKVENTFLFYFRGVNGVIYQFGKIFREW